MINPQKAQMLLNAGWNSHEAGRLAKVIGADTGILYLRYKLSAMINDIIRAIYLMVFCEKV